MTDRGRIVAVLWAGWMAAGAGAQTAARIPANALKADVSFLASDALEGRGTPSRGLDIAAEYIAAQFRRAGLEPAGDDDYFQTARYANITANLDSLALALEMGGKEIKAAPEFMAISDPAGVELSHAPAWKVTMDDPAALAALTLEQIKGKVLIVEVPNAPVLSPEDRRKAIAIRAGLAGLARLQPSLVILPRANGQPTSRTARLREVSAPSSPTLSVWDEAFRTALAAAKPGPLEGTISVHVAAPVSVPVKLRNVIGVLRGADPVLRDTYVMVTAHYDHLGVRGSGEGDHIYNGANDDASGTASVIEIANALAALPEKPRRSIVFMALFGEEIGGVGSRYYTQHPVFPAARTVADVNLEQVGRTDDSEGPRIGQFNLTGFDYTNIAAFFIKAGAETGVGAVKHPANSDAFFNRSDNAMFADVGIPSTTLSVAYVFPDYHEVGDEWPKLDYENMAKVDWTVALGLLGMANSDEAPQWNRDNPRTEAYVKAREKQP